MIYPNGHIGFTMYEDGGRLIGVGKITLPSIRYKTTPITGAGIMGDLEVPLSSMIDAMTTDIEFSSVADAAVQLGTNEWHDVAVYIADQYFDSDSRREEKEKIRIEMTIRPKETKLGDVQTASAANASGSYSVCKYTVYKEEKKVIDIDPLNQVHMVNGVDCAADIRKALGMM